VNRKARRKTPPVYSPPPSLLGEELRLPPDEGTEDDPPEDLPVEEAPEDSDDPDERLGVAPDDRLGDWDR